MTELTSMRNIGKVIAQRLKSVGIQSAEELVQAGSKDAFFRLKTRDPNVCLVLLYALHGAIENVDYNRLSDDVKRDLKCFNDTFKETK